MDAKVTKMIQNAFEFDVIVTQSEFEALVLECSQIKQHKPKYNIFIEGRQGIQLCEGDKGSIPAHFGRAAKGRRQMPTYIGPYTSSFAVRENGGDRMQCVPPAALQQKSSPRISAKAVPA